MSMNQLMKIFFFIAFKIKLVVPIKNLEKLQTKISLEILLIKRLSFPKFTKVPFLKWT
jgi:hypothetical protein